VSMATRKIAMIFGIKVSVTSWTCVSACIGAMTIARRRLLKTLAPLPPLLVLPA